MHALPSVQVQCLGVGTVVHHVGPFPDLEHQMCGWVPGQGESPDRLDALVWAVWAFTLEPIGIA